MLKKSVIHRNKQAWMTFKKEHLGHEKMKNFHKKAEYFIIVL